MEDTHMQHQMLLQCGEEVGLQQEAIFSFIIKPGALHTSSSLSFRPLLRRCRTFTWRGNVHESEALGCP